MRLGINLGYWGAGMDARQPRRRPGGRPARLRRLLGRRGVRLRRGHRALLGRRPDRADRRRLGDLPDPGPYARDDRDDRRHPRLPLRRPLPPRPRRLGAAGLRGLVRRQVRQAAGPHPRVRRDRPQGDDARAAVLRGRALDAAAARRSGQAAQAHRAPGARAHPALHRRDRPEEPGADRRDRRRRAADLPLRRAPGGDRVAHLRAGREKAGQDAGGLRRLPDRCRSPSATTRTSARWPTRFRPYTALYVGGMGSRKQNFYNQLAQRMGYEKEAAEIQDKYLAGDKEGAAAADPARADRPDHAARLRSSASPTGCRPTRRPASPP